MRSAPSPIGEQCSSSPPARRKERVVRVSIGSSRAHISQPSAQSARPRCNISPKSTRGSSVSASSSPQVSPSHSRRISRQANQPSVGLREPNTSLEKDGKPSCPHTYHAKRKQTERVHDSPLSTRADSNQSSRVESTLDPRDALPSSVPFPPKAKASSESPFAGGMACERSSSAADFEHQDNSTGHDAGGIIGMRREGGSSPAAARFKQKESFMSAGPHSCNLTSEETFFDERRCATLGANTQVGD
ncbi:MAG: hypothetical protein SGPRY_012088, partial [Prymnesium sp.]